MANGVQNLIYRAFRTANITASGETPTSTARDDAFTKLNGLLSSWSAEQLVCYGHASESFSLSSGTMEYTWATGGSFNSARPVKVTGATAVSGTFTMPLEVLPMHEARRRTANADGKSVVLPSLLGWDNGFPTMNILIFPPPSGSPGTLKVNSIKPIAAFSAVTDDITMPPGWELALEYNLAVLLSGEWNGVVREELAASAQSLKAALVQVNQELLAAPAVPVEG